MTVDVKSGLGVIETVQRSVQRHGNTQDELIPILNEVNRKIGYLPKEALAEISQLLKLPQSQVTSVASFYHMLSTKPRGRHVIKFCESAPCHVAGGRQLWEALTDELQLKPGETSEDGRWTLITTSCLGVCGVGPVIIIDDDIYGNVEANHLTDILARYE